MAKEIENWWDAAAKGYQKDSDIHTRAAHYGPFCPDEDKLRLLGTVKGKKILELGCGGAQCSIAFAKKGAICTGIDLSKKQLEYAKKLAKKNKVKIKLIKADIQTLRGIKSNTYDIVFSAYAFQYIPNLTKCFKEVHRVLKKKGVFVFSFDNPYYLTINPKTLKIENSYYEIGRNETREAWSDGSEHKFVFYKTKISDIYDSLVETGLSVEKIIEPPFFKGQKAWRRKEWKKIYPEKLVKLIPPTIIFKSRKIK